MHSSIIAFISFCSVTALYRNFNETDWELDYNQDSYEPETKYESLSPYPFLVKIYGEKICSGALYKEEMVITTASCAQGKIADYNGVGIFDDDSPHDFPSVFDILQIVSHPKYAIAPRAYDIAIIHIDTRRYRTNSTSIELAREHESTLLGEELTVTTWDVDNQDDEQPEINNELSSFHVTVQNPTACGDLIDQLHPHLEFCAGFSESYGGLYDYHIGSPAYIENNDKTALVGIFAKTDSTENGYLPGEFTRVSHFTRWIDATVRDLHNRY